MPEPQTRSASATIGVLLTRVVVPLWILTGALFKLVEHSPALLPKNILEPAHALGLDLDWVLATLIGAELFAVLVMVFMGRFARAMAIFMLGVFCLILLGLIAQGQTSCGCLGAKSPSPVLMLIIDALLLLGVLWCKPAAPPAGSIGRWPIGATALGTVAAFAVSFTVVLTQTAPQPDPGPDPVETPGGSTDATTRTPKPLPSYWYVSEEERAAWIGRPWTDVDLFQYMPELPTGLDEGVRYAVFYGRTCDHCQEMFEKDLAPNPDLAARVTAIEVPSETGRLHPPEAWPMPETRCALMELPLGPNWIIETPLALRIEDGIVRCAVEGGHEECFIETP